MAFSFYAALAIGIGALLTSVFMSTAVALIFTVIFDIFYTFFAIRFISYAVRFHAIEEAMENSLPEDAEEGEDTAGHGRELAGIPSPARDRIEASLKKWTDEKRFMQPGVTLGDVSQAVGTNDKYLSLYINRHMGKTFREWINELRISEAKCLLAEYPDMAVGEIALLTGFTTKSHFGQQFRAVTGYSPSGWRQNAPKRDR